MGLNAKLHIETIEFERYCPLCGRGCPETSHCEFVPWPMPQVPIIVEPQPVSTGLFEMNHPGPDSPLVVTCNYLHTHALLGEVLIKWGGSCYLLSVDTGGDPLEMALVKGKFTDKDVEKAIEASDIISKVRHRNVVLPGLCKLDTIKGWQCLKGPVSALEIPLFLQFSYPISPG